MRIVSSLFDSIEGIYWFPVIALLIFVVIFIVMTIHTFTLKKNYVKEVSRLPLDPDESEKIHES